MSSFTYIVTTGSARPNPDNVVLETDDKREVVDRLERLPVRDAHFVNGQVGSEWLFDHRGDR